MSNKLVLEEILKDGGKLSTRKTIDFGDGIIEIYEPSEEIQNNMINFIKENDIVEFSDLQVMYYLL